VHGLRTSSVLILDDDDKHALAIQKSLTLRGIGAILVPGALDEDRPECTFKGIRVAVLDIHLGAGTDAHGRARHTGRVVDSLIDTENGPYVAVIWTDNPDDYEVFCGELDTIRCPPVLTVKLEKSEVLPLGRKLCADAILRAIDDVVREAQPLEFANLWEQTVRDAATETIVSLQLGRQPEAQSSRALDFLAALLKSEADDQAMEDDADGMRALLAALNPVHFDKVGARSADMLQAELSVVEPIRRHAKTTTPNLSVTDRSQLNDALLVDRRSRGFGPGQLYEFHEIESIGIGPAIPSEKEVREDTVVKDHLERAGDLPVVFLEVSAACDHQQGKIRTARLLAGVVFDASVFGRGIDKSQRVSPAKGQYIRVIGPISILCAGPDDEGEVFVVWNAHFPVSISADSMTECPTIGRLREPLLADIRAWLGYSAGRPGYTSVG
jgi:hypothetical protein